MSPLDMQYVVAAQQTWQPFPPQTQRMIERLPSMPDDSASMTMSASSEPMGGAVMFDAPMRGGRGGGGRRGGRGGQ